ncbi:hypothetical protein TNCV_970341 [Trichonephila clavipes]|nr:hypothetical protein TNCV_970341 [Trichonephila clavipes]
MPPTEGRRQERSGQYDKARETRTTTSGTIRAAERGDQSSLNRRYQVEEQWNRQYPAEQHQEKETQYGSLGRRSGG